MRYFGLLAAMLVLLMAGGCEAFKNVSATQPSPVLMFGESLALNGVKTAANKAYEHHKIEYFEYMAIVDTLTTLRTRAMANGGAITTADIKAAVEAGAWRAIQEYLPDYLKEPETLPPPPPSPTLYDNTPIPG